MIDPAAPLEYVPGPDDPADLAIGAFTPRRALDRRPGGHAVAVRRTTASRTSTPCGARRPTWPGRWSTPSTSRRSAGS